MVDPIAGRTDGAKPSAVTRVAAPTPVATATTPIPTPAAPRPETVAQSLAAAPPVDADRVATIKKAIAEGRFPITPATIADRLIALKLQWLTDDAPDQRPA